MNHTRETGSREPLPHQLANELTQDESLQAVEAEPETRRPPGNDHEVLPRVERSVGRTIVMVIVAAVIIGLIVSAILFRQKALLAIGALFIIPFLIMVSAPVWIAGVTKQAQDETLREQREPDRE